MDIRRLDEQSKPVNQQQYPKFIQSKIAQVNHLLSKNMELQGDTNAEVVFQYNFSYPVTLSHMGIRYLRSKGYTVRITGGFSLKSFDNMLDKYSKAEGLSKPSL